VPVCQSVCVTLSTRILPHILLAAATLQVLYTPPPPALRDSEYMLT
jgi:hypothetical protein